MRLLLLFALMGLTAAQPRCDPETQYEKNGQCCRMCGPGTRMLVTGTCEEPRCEECGVNDYQDAYTIDAKCKIQPYCDSNKNFKHVTHVNKKKRTICECKLGFHCSSKECITCVPHSVCPPGEGAHIKGNHTHNTVCKKCPEYTYSNESSWSSACKKMTECESDYRIKEMGTVISDNICERDPRSHVVLLIIFGIVLIVAIALAIGFYVYVKRVHAGGKFKDCFRPDMGEQREPLEGVRIVTYPAEEVSMLQPEQEENIMSEPEENEDDQSLDRSLEVGYTVNGQPVQQDMTKTEQLSEEESQCSKL
ncbi:tumor necrosis factor receptor superfamily member 5 [Notolabrus celidotus]|uniref:tumor necrosis factor receptor superfamily member 5 n=1 Tax=Notolabrus celidotus TaxID=1203425 RepID=UPI00148F4F2C|nr:tumor necrosis factor receptor superfamily member 5 [Notolabrus celidotus]